MKCVAHLRTALKGDLEIVWMTIHNDLPGLAEQMGGIFGTMMITKEEIDSSPDTFYLQAKRST